MHYTEYFTLLDCSGFCRSGHICKLRSLQGGYNLMWGLQIAHEMDMICCLEKANCLFENKWKHYVNVIVT